MTNDVDGNGINDYCTADVAGLRHLRPPGKFGGIRMIGAELAKADGAPAADDGSVAEPWAGYWCFALRGWGGSGMPLTPYGNRHPTRFGFIAVPAGYGRSGRVVFLMNEEGSCVKRDPGSACYFLRPPAAGVSMPAGKLDHPFDMAPIDVFEFRWAKFD
jgi:hypothetical protein